jgi:hypothetical protein
MSDKFATAMVGMASELAAEPLWQPYAEYLELRGNRVQERARQAAESFVEVARHWPYEERKRFSLWLMDRAGRVVEQIGSIVGGGGHGRFCPGVESGVSTQSLRDSRRLYHARQRIPAMR